MKSLKVNVEMDSSDTSYVGTYSQDEEIERYLNEGKQNKQQQEREKELSRQQHFEKELNEYEKVLDLRGFKFYCFGHLRIKFSFEPSYVAKYVSKKAKFYLTMVYKKNHWKIKHDTIPCNIKRKIYRLFYNGNGFAIMDENVIDVIIRIYEILVEWADDHEKFRLERFNRYKNQEDVELDSDDEELFLTHEEKIKLYQKKIKVLNRMLPPKLKAAITRQKKKELQG